MVPEKVYGFSAVSDALDSVMSSMTSPVVFHGREHIGKYTLTMSIAEKLVSFPENIHVLSLQEGKTQITIEQVRKLLDDIKLLPYGADKYRIVVIDDAQYLNSISENALLKLLEEPPEYVRIFIIVDSVSNLLPTIRSRCSLIALHHIQEDIDKVYNSLSMDSDLKDFIRFVYRDQFGKFLSEEPDTIERLRLQKQIVESLPKLKDRSEVIKYQVLLPKADTVETLKAALDYYRPKTHPYVYKSYEARLANCIIDALCNLSKGLDQKLVIDLLISSICSTNKNR